MLSGTGPAWTAIFLATAALASPGAAQEPPPELVEATEEASAICRGLGGEPSILDGYQTIHDLNADGAPDFVTDRANLQCAGAWSAFCGPSGCPVSAWLSAPGGFERFDFGRLEAFAIRDGAAGEVPEFVARYAPTSCGSEAMTSCTRTWRFTSNAPAEPAVDLPAATARPAPAAKAKASGPQAEEVQAARPADALPEAASAPEREEEAPTVELPPMVAPGWTLRNVPGSSPLALGGGTGEIASLAAFCLSGQPFLAIRFRRQPAGDMVTLGFDFSSGPLEAAAGLEETAGGAYVIALADGPLVSRLSGRDSEVALDVDGRRQGALSLKGSTKSIRDALAACSGG